MDKQGVKRRVYLLGNTGSGKTLLIRRTHETLRGRVQVKAIYYQPNSVYDVARLSAAGIPAVIRTEAFRPHLAEKHFSEEAEAQLVFYEFSGRTGYSLPKKQEDISRVFVFSVTDGDEKPVKYPRLFKEIELVIVNKIDLLPFTDFSLSNFEMRLKQINPLVPLIKLSCRSGVGLDHWRNWVLKMYGHDFMEESGSLPRLNNYPGMSCF